MKSLIFIFMVTIIPVLVSGCEKIFLDTDDETSHPQNDTIAIGYKQVYVDLKNNFQLKFDSIMEDSRCPIGAACFWEGNAAVSFDLIIPDHEQHAFVLNTCRAFTNDTIIHWLHFQLAGILPYPEIGKTRDVKDYVVQVVIKKK